jgi:hypothetical protein
MTLLIAIVVSLFIGAAIGFVAASLCAAARAGVERDCSGWEDDHD